MSNWGERKEHFFFAGRSWCILVPMDRARALTRNKLRASSSQGASTRPRGCVSCRSGPSSRDLALSVTRTYDTLQNPAKSNVTYSESLDEFVRVAINAYECGLMMDHLMAEGAAGEAEGRTIVEDFEGLTEVDQSPLPNPRSGSKTLTRKRSGSIPSHFLRTSPHLSFKSFLVSSP